MDLVKAFVERVNAFCIAHSEAIFQEAHLNYVNHGNKRGALLCFIDGIERALELTEYPLVWLEDKGAVFEDMQYPAVVKMVREYDPEEQFVVHVMIHLESGNSPMQCGMFKRHAHILADPKDKEEYTLKTGTGQDLAQLTTCAQCGAWEHLLRCNRCHSVHYCNRTCQKKHWRTHKRKCSYYAYLYNKLNSSL